MPHREIRAPFTDEQVELLNRFQQAGWMHPFTCRNRNEHRGQPDTLVATTTGWHCPAQGCEYRQYWAHSFMGNRVWMEHMDAQQRRLFSTLRGDS